MFSCISNKHVSYKEHCFKLLLLVFIGAKKTREIIFSVLRDACCDGDLTVDEAIEAAKDILARNAIKLYKINIDAKAFNSKDILSWNSMNIDNSSLDNGVSLVRILWVDASGQHRCRVSVFSLKFSSLA